jgi:hypothetical protein
LGTVKYSSAILERNLTFDKNIRNIGATMPRAKRALPMWTNQEPTEKVHIVNVKPKVTHQDKGTTGGVKRPFYDIKKVFKTN